ncbi:hypothetical protein HYX17_00750 [Candidatus Woesearchaeota archaeon]|nr:hypothetical protein [Candidatus Woesearchaeota archaeon]
MAVLALVLIVTTIFLVSTKNSSFTKVAGKNQLKLINAYEKGEFSRQYIIQSARNSINNALLEFGQNGGLNQKKCIKDKYFIWSKDCKPSKESFLIYFDKYFKSYLSLNKKISSLNFKYKIEENNLIVESTDFLLFDLDKDKVEVEKQRLLNNYITGKAAIDSNKEAILIGTYKRDSSFKEKINFDFDILDKIYEEIKNSKDCLTKGDITSNIVECIKDKRGFQWKINRESNFINFEITTSYKILRNKNNQLAQENLVIKFKTDLENM